ncbi:unnamed protein product [marine sediment metagenome]|uniref:Uncharacterized protein n=1 Tax=marine sediment metagenome TaxID=412755 RepID=X1FKI7_9ZZZZ
MSAEDKVLTKAQIASLWLGKHWMWVALAVLIIAGCYISASYVWNMVKGGNGGKKKK